jgi:hypothetical protein
VNGVNLLKHIIKGDSMIWVFLIGAIIVYLLFRAKSVGKNNKSLSEGFDNYNKYGHDGYGELIEFATYRIFKATEVKDNYENGKTTRQLYLDEVNELMVIEMSLLKKHGMTPQDYDDFLEKAINTKKAINRMER